MTCGLAQRLLLSSPPDFIPICRGAEYSAERDRGRQALRSSDLLQNPLVLASSVRSITAGAQ